MQTAKKIGWWIISPFVFPALVFYGVYVGVKQFPFWKAVGYWQRTRIKILDQNKFENDVVFEGEEENV